MAAWDSVCVRGYVQTIYMITTCQFISDQILFLHLRENQAKNTIFDVQNGYRKGLKAQKFILGSIYPLTRAVDCSIDSSRVYAALLAIR